MKLPVERLGEALSNRRLQVKVRLAVMPDAPAEEVRKVTDAIKSSHVEFEETVKAPSNAISEVTTDDEHPAKTNYDFDG